jgi:hypothetical protein
MGLVAIFSIVSVGVTVRTDAAAATPTSQIQLVAADPPAATGPDANDINVRQAFGLSTDIKYIDQLKSAAPVVGAATVDGSQPAPLAPGGHPRYGIVLSSAEQSELDYRAITLEKAASTPALTAYLAAHQDTYGGMYLDHQTGGKLTYLFTADVVTRQAELQQLLAVPADRLVVRQVGHTDAELKAAQQTFNVNLALLKRLGLDSTRVDTINNAAVRTRTPLAWRASRAGSATSASPYSCARSRQGCLPAPPGEASPVHLWAVRASPKPTGLGQYAPSASSCSVAASTSRPPPVTVRMTG